MSPLTAGAGWREDDRWRPTAYRPISPQALAAELAGRLARVRGIVRVALDGPPAARPDEFADSLVEPLRLRGRPVVLIRAASFWRDASLRLEYGHQDVEAYPDWLDAAALRREVLDPLVTSHSYLPSLRDPVTNRATRDAVRAAEPDTVAIVSGPLLLGRGLPFDSTVHLAMSAAARARHTPAELAWTLPAFDRYDAQTHPLEHADVVVRLEDPRHPAISD